MPSDSGENCDPMTRIAGAAPVMSSPRRATNAAKMVSPRRGFVAISCRRRSRGTATISPAVTTLAETRTRSPLSMFNSPRNRPGPWRATTLSPPSTSTTMSTSALTSTKKS